MEICIKYKDGTIDKLNTDSLTSASGLSEITPPGIMTKYRINWREFVIGKEPINLNVYIYYYQKNNERGSKIKDRKYLDDLVFYENDQMLGKDWSQEQIAEKGKALPYGLLEPGSWFTIVPANKKKDILEISQDGNIVLIWLDEYDELVDVSLLAYYEAQNGLFNTSGYTYKERFINLYSVMTDTNNNDAEQISQYELTDKIGLQPKLLNEMIKEHNEKLMLAELYH